MAKGNEFSGRLEWRINVADGTSKTLVPESGIIQKSCRRLQGVVVGITLRIWSFLHKAWEIGVNEPKKFFHCLKVGMALSLVSLFYYMRPLYDGYGTNAMWAVMTVVVVFEYTVGATLCKCVNRAMATFLAGSLGIGVHWVANQCGEKFEPVVLEFSVFLLAAAATFFRFIPSVKARFDYGLLIFILTFSLVSVSGFRVDKLFEMAHQRLSTITIGVSFCIITSMLFCPVWAGQELYSLINRNLEKLADSLDGCVAEYFTDDGTKEDSSKNLQGYKCVLNSKATEESMANFARWEPAHGRFNFGHPWKQYLKIGSSMRNCAYCIETLNGCISSEIQAPEFLKKHFNDVCMRLSSHSSNVLKELGNTMKSMTKSSKTESSVREMNFTVQELQSALKSLPYQLALFTSPALEASNNGKDEAPTESSKVPLLEILPVTTVASLLIEIAARIEGIVEEVDELANQAEFKPASKKGSKKTQQSSTDDKD